MTAPTNPMYDPRCNRALPIPGAGCARGMHTCRYPECTYPEPAPRRVPTEVERTAGHVRLDPTAAVIARLGAALEESRREVQRLHADNDRLRQQIRGGYTLGSGPAPECLTSHPQMHADCDGCTCSCHPPLARVLAEHLPAIGEAVTELLAPRRRWWHRLTRRNP